MGEVYKAEDTRPAHRSHQTSAGCCQSKPVCPAPLSSGGTISFGPQSPKLVTIYAIEEADGLDFIVMEFVEGQNLKA